jgi:rRNA processing protein Krr1/Pno1
MDNEIQLISDGDGLAVIGDPAAVERFLVSEGLSSKDLGLPRLGAVLSTGAAAAQAGSEIAANSGRWVKLTKESAQLVKKHGLRESSKTGLSTGVVKGSKGQVGGFVSFVRAPGSLLTNPALLAGAAGIMAQIAMQQTMDEITDYLATIDEKLDDVLRAQEDAVRADMIGAGFDIEEAMTIRDHGGRVNEVTWSKVQATSATIARTQAYALGQLDALAEKTERKTKIGDLAKTAKEAESKAQGWLVVLARCFQLQDAIAVLELDRVLDAAPGDLDGHRLGLKASRQKRLDTISRSTGRLMARMDAAAGTANTKVLLHPTTSPAVVQSREHVAVAVAEFHGRLGIESGRHSLEAKRWVDAASEVRDKVLETGAERVDASRRLGNETIDRARSVQRRLSSGIAERALRPRGGENEERDEKG